MASGRGLAGRSPQRFGPAYSRAPPGPQRHIKISLYSGVVVPELAISKARELLHPLADLIFRHAQLVELLEIEPKLGTGAEPVSEAQRCVRRDGALAVDDASHPVYR